MKTFILIAKCYDKEVGGPAEIVRGLIKELKRRECNFIRVLMKEDSKKRAFIKEVFKSCLKNKDAVVNVHTHGLMIPALVYACSKINKANSYYLTVHGLYCLESSINNNKKKKNEILEKILIKNFQHLICVSEIQREDIERIYGRSQDIIVIPNATDAVSDVIPSGEPGPLKLLFLGGLSNIKGIDYVLDLCSCLKRKGALFDLSIYGRDEKRLSWFEDYIMNHDLSNEVQYKGVLTEKQKVYDTIAAADYLLCLSRQDTYNVAIAEGLALGCPVIASDRCGAAYLIRGEEGLVINSDTEKDSDFDKTYKYIKSFEEDKDKRRRVYEGRKAFADGLSWTSIGDTYFRLN